MEKLYRNCQRWSAESCNSHVPVIHDQRRQDCSTSGFLASGKPSLTDSIMISPQSGHSEAAMLSRTAGVSVVPGSSASRDSAVTVEDGDEEAGPPAAEPEGTGAVAAAVSEDDSAGSSDDGSSDEEEEEENEDDDDDEEEEEVEIEEEADEEEEELEEEEEEAGAPVSAPVVLAASCDDCRCTGPSSAASSAACSARRVASLGLRAKHCSKCRRAQDWWKTCAQGNTRKARDSTGSAHRSHNWSAATMTCRFLSSAMSLLMVAALSVKSFISFFNISMLLL